MDFIESCRLRRSASGRAPGCEKKSPYFAVAAKEAEKEVEIPDEMAPAEKTKAAAKKKKKKKRKRDRPTSELKRQTLEEEQRTGEKAAPAKKKRKMAGGVFAQIAFKRMTPKERIARIRLAAELAIVAAAEAEIAEPVTQSSNAPITEADLIPEQIAVLEAAKEGLSFTCTGAGGNGKSALIGLILALDRKRTAVAAPTGMSACGVGGVTIWNLVGISPTMIEHSCAEEIASRLRTKKPGKFDFLRNLRRIIIEETSLLAAPLADLVSRIISIVRNDERPFGGVPVAFFGDPLQLPPVFKRRARQSGVKRKWKRGKNIEEDDMPFLTEGTACAELDLLSFTLMHNHRQLDPTERRIFQDIRFGRPTARVVTALKARVGAVLKPPHGIKPVFIFSKREPVRLENERQLRRLPSGSIVFTCQDRYQGKPGYKARQRLAVAADKRAEKTITLKIGAQVMLLTNLDVRAALFNGACGVVERLNASDGNAHVRFESGKLAKIDYHNYDIENDTDAMTRFQMPLALGWAVTSHKIQGRTLNWAITSLSTHDIFQAGQVYTIVSRMRRLSGLSIIRFDPSTIYAHPRALAQHFAPRKYTRAVRVWQQRDWPLQAAVALAPGPATMRMFSFDSPVYSNSKLTRRCRPIADASALLDTYKAGALDSDSDSDAAAAAAAAAAPTPLQPPQSKTVPRKTHQTLWRTLRAATGGAPADAPPGLDEKLWSPISLRQAAERIDLGDSDDPPDQLCVVCGQWAAAKAPDFFLDVGAGLACCAPCHARVFAAVDDAAPIEILFAGGDVCHLSVPPFPALAKEYPK
jgi:hypothetical protein